MASTLALRAKSAQWRYENSPKSQRDFEKYMGECAALAFDALVEQCNSGRMPAQQVAIAQATRVAIKLMGEAFADYLSCPVENDHHHQDFAQLIWSKAVQHGHESVQTVRKVASYVGLS
jgi:hypothetical protein